jgi:hypothetical protein
MKQNFKDNFPLPCQLLIECFSIPPPKKLIINTLSPLQLQLAKITKNRIGQKNLEFRI